MMFLTFLIAAALLAVTPGPGMAYVMARTAAGGRAEGLASCLGTAAGGLVHVAAATLGLSVLIAQSALAFGIVKYVGAAFLVYLGVRMLLRRVPPSTPTTTLPAVSPRGARRAVIDGFVVEALNVKTALFFLAFLPQFVNPEAAVALQLVLLGATCVALNTASDVGVALLTHRLLAAARKNTHPYAHARRATLMTRASGLVMVALGAVVALTRRQPA